MASRFREGFPPSIISGEIPPVVLCSARVPHYEKDVELLERGQRRPWRCQRDGHRLGELGISSMKKGRLKGGYRTPSSA